ncbi:MAG: porin family protein [Pseudomonadales bacterium]|nr:porin family protein [Pseudomonadales bacterium]
MTSPSNAVAAVFSCLLILSLPAFVQADQRTDSGLYISGGVGLSAIDSNLSLDKDNGIAPRVSVGWQWTPNFGIEGSYHAFDEAKDPRGTLAKFDTNGASLAGTVRLPVSERLALFARLGNLWWNIDLSDTNCSRGPAGCTTTKYTLDDSSLFAGFGLGFEINRLLELELSYDNFQFDMSGPLLNVFDHDTSVIGVTLKLKL